MAVLQKLSGEHEGRDPPFLLSLGRHSKQAGDERCLTWAVSFVPPSHLSFPNHVHHLVSLSCSPRALEGKEAQSWLDESFAQAVVLFDQGMQGFDLSQFDLFGKDSRSFKLCHLD
jgi:hypothetical protein